MKVTLYTLKGCSSCFHAKELLKRAELDYEEVIVRDHIDYEEFHERYKTVRAFPFTVIDEHEFVGIVDLAKFLLKEGYVTSKKNE